ncbi:Tetratrico peptide repeat-containing protein [Psychrobacillus sp. OK028]|uniref:tetratricopeptide repeat protein n=1 Tax=Psychrobacillus sp. OK028 TaxID=1884359 RepID=UPI00089198CF|nr:tetratricopeptide repeat protein [Psychrobacillus sp. OK028]SDN09305.1 Tetratrico peptide repeat-containing protein [Psychrobacillus sp. OK028]
MQKEIEEAIILRNTGRTIESNELLLQLVEKYPNNASIHYQCGWSFDVLGEETQAISFYETAIKLGLPNDELEGAIIGLGSTYRALGFYEKSKDVFLNGIELFPNNKAIQVFYAITLYNLSEHSNATELLLNILLETTNEKQILAYEKALKFYSKHLDDVWK